MKTIAELLTQLIPNDAELVWALDEVIRATASEEKVRPVLENLLPKTTGIMLVEGEEWEEEEEWDTPTERKELPPIITPLPSDPPSAGTCPSLLPVATPTPRTPILSSHTRPAQDGWLLLCLLLLLLGGVLLFVLPPSPATLAWWLIEQ